MKLERRTGTKTYYYLSEKDSLLYDKVKNSSDPKDVEIKRLIEGKAAQSRSAHCASTY